MDSCIRLLAESPTNWWAWLMKQSFVVSEYFHTFIKYKDYFVLKSITARYCVECSKYLMVWRVSFATLHI